MTEDHDDYVLRWPRELFKTEIAALVNQRGRGQDWSARCGLTLEDAFVDTTPRDAFTAVGRAVTDDPWASPATPSRAGLDPGQDFLVKLLRRADRLREVGMRAPYYSERRAGAKGTPRSRCTLRREGAASTSTGSAPAGLRYRPCPCRGLGDGRQRVFTASQAARRGSRTATSPCSAAGTASAPRHRARAALCGG